MIMKNDERTMFEIFFENHEEIQKKTILVMLEKDFFVRRKEIFFERVGLKTAKRQKRNQKEKKN